MTRIAATFAALLLVLLAASVPAGAQSLDGTTIEVSPQRSSIDLGEMLDIVVAVTNHTDEPASGLVAHIDITNTDQAGSVDPEDWTATLSKPVGSLDPGTSTVIDWTIQPISPGTFTLYAVALAPAATDVASSNTLTIEVTDRRSLNPQGILPVSLAIPAGIGALLIHQIRRNRRA